MAVKFSTWLRETARLYLRYMAVAFGCVPFAVGAAWAKQAGWNERVIVPVLLCLAFITAFLALKRLSRRQSELEPRLSSFEAEWADLLKVGTGSIVQFITLDENAEATWQEVLSPAVIKGATEAQMFQLFCLSHHQRQKGFDQPRHLESDDALQQMMKGETKPMQRRERAGSQTPEIPPRAVPAQSLPRAVQPLFAGSH
jgi:hypothetical protein